jgi:hypothetical protein
MKLLAIWQISLEPIESSSATATRAGSECRKTVVQIAGALRHGNRCGNATAFQTTNPHGERFGNLMFRWKLPVSILVSN